MAKRIDIKQIVKDYHDFVADTKEKYMTFLKEVLKTTENNIIRFEQGLKIDFNGGVVLFNLWNDGGDLMVETEHNDYMSVEDLPISDLTLIAVEVMENVCGIFEED